VVMTYHNEVKATNIALRNVIRTNDCDVFIARDALPIDFDHFKDIPVTYLSQMSCMKEIYEQITLKKEISNLSSLQLRSILMCNIRRMGEAAGMSKTEYIFYMEPDVLVRRRIKPETKFAMECLDANRYPAELLEYIERLSNRKYGIKGWGYCAGFASVVGFKAVSSWAESNQSLLLKLIELDHRFIFADFAFPILFHLVGFEVGKTKQIVECNRNPFWRISSKPVVHQYRRNYS
jgi:hypothetical protein